MTGFSQHFWIGHYDNIFTTFLDWPLWQAFHNIFGLATMTAF